MGEINLGSIARLCKNFEIPQLKLVAPRCDPLSKASIQMALRGKDLLDNAKYYPNLLEAISDCKRVVATCGRIDHGQIPLHSSESSLDWILRGPLEEPAAIVFGREDSGLTNQELQLAQKVIQLPTSSDYPSLNLSHAVAIVLNELSQCSNKTAPSFMQKKKHSLANSKEIYDFLMQAKELLLKIGFLYPHTANARISKIQAIIQRAQIRKEEVNLLRGILRQTKWFIDK